MGIGDLVRSATNKATDLVKNELEKQSEIKQKKAENRAEIKQHMAEQAKMQRVMLQINSGFQQVNATSTSTMFQRQDGSVYFNTNFNDRFLFIEYSWSGPMYETTINSTTNTTGQEITKGKGGKMTAGAIIGTAIMPGVGTVVGAAIGAGGKKTKKKNSQSNTRSIHRQREILTPATLKFKNTDTGNIVSIVIGCNSLIDSQIKGFVITKEQSVHDISIETSDALKGIKALKELLDMGAITQEEFNTKKHQLLNQ